MALSALLQSQPHTVTAGDASDWQYKIVKIARTQPTALQTGVPTGLAVELAGADEVAFGVAYTNPSETGASIQVIRDGIAKVEVDGAIAIGTAVYSDANGIASATGVNNPIGIVIGGAGAAGDVAEVDLAI